MKKQTRKLAGKLFTLFKNTKDNIIQPETEDVNQQLIMRLNKKHLPSWAQLKQLPKFLNKTERLQLTVALMILILSSLTVVWRLYINHSESVPAYGGEYTEGLIGVPNLVNPILATSDVDRDLTKLVFSGLMQVNEQGQLVPDLANGYTINAEQTTYTFELRNNIRWHDDELITADDVIFTINSIKNPEYKSPYKNSFNGVTVSRINDQTVQFKLEKPFSPFLSILTIGILPEHLWYSIPAFGANLADLNLKPIGSGSYQFKSFDRDGNGNIKNYHLEAYTNYYLNSPFIKKLHFKFYPDFFTGVTALQNKNIDGLIYLPNEYKQELTNNKITLHNLQFPQYTAIFFNPKNNELLSNKDFRHALAMGVDKERILREVLNGDGQIIDSPILPGLLGYDENIKSASYDPEVAKAMLDQLGWPQNEDSQFRSQTDENGENPIELSLKLTTIDHADNVKTVSILQENWQALGIKTELDIIPKDRMKQTIIDPRNYQVLVYGEVVNTNSGPYPFWHSSQNQAPGLNLSVMANKDIDDYLDIINSATTDQAKLEPLKRFQEKLLELDFAIFLYNPTYTYPTNSKLRGLENLKFINLPSDRFNNITAWYVKTKRVLSN